MSAEQLAIPWGGATSAVHDFSDDLAYSEEQANAAYWLTLYRGWFPDFLSRTVVPDGVGQRKGRDTVVVLTNGENLKVQEKVRRREDTGDVLLEYEHRYPSGYVKPGWIDTDSAFDFLAYVFEPSRVGYLFPFQSLRAAWRAHRDEWMGRARSKETGWRLVPARNAQYVSWSIAVPTMPLYRAVYHAQIGRWD